MNLTQRGQTPRYPKGLPSGRAKRYPLGLRQTQGNADLAEAQRVLIAI